MVNGRRKGHSFERQIANQLKEIYPNAARQLEYQEGFGYDIANTGKLRIQCKSYANYAPISKIFEAYKSCNDDNQCIPMLVTKGNNMEVMAVVPFYFMKELIKLYQEKEDAWKVKQQSKLDDKP